MATQLEEYLATDEGRQPAASQEARKLLHDVALDNSESEWHQYLQADISELGQSQEPAHLTVPIAVELVRRAELSREITQALLPHLSRCSFCRATLRQTLSLSGASEIHLGYELLRHAEEWEGRREAGKEASAKAVSDLHEKGIATVYMQYDGSIVKELPDGAVEPYVPEGCCEQELIAKERM